MTDKPRILVLDIEWRPTKAYVWQPWKENIHPEKIIEHGGLLCVGLKWLGDKVTHLFSEWEHGREEMVRQAHSYLCEADAVITYNGDKYDLPKLQGEFLLSGLAPPPPPTSIDVLKAVKKLGLFMNRLAFVGPYFKVGKKLEHEGFSLWVKVERGDERAQIRMGRYCIQDVRLLERLYMKVRPYIRTHPHMGNVGSAACGACGSKNVQSRGYRRTKSFRIQRLHCQSCGSWQDGKRQKVT